MFRILLATVVVFGGCGLSTSRPPETAGSTEKIQKISRAQAEQTPRARREAVVDIIHGQRIADPYRWLEVADSKETKEWLNAHDKYARERLLALPGHALLEKRLKELSYIEQVSAPIRRGTRFFFSRQDPQKEKVIWYWREGEKGEAKTLIDPNALSKDGSISLRGLSISWEGEKVAYTLSKNAADTSTMYVMDVRTGKVSDVDVIEGARYAHASWMPKGEGFYYTRLPTDKSIPIAELPGYAAVYFHQIGQAPEKDTLVFPKTGDPRKFIYPQLSRDGTLLFVYISYGWARNDVFFKDLKRSRDKNFRPFIKDKEALFYVHPHKRKLFIHTNEAAPRYRLFKVDLQRIQRQKWKEIIPEQKEAVLTDVSIIGDHLALQYLQRATTKLSVATLTGKMVREVELPDLGTSQGLVGHPDDDVAYYSFSSFTTPQTVYRTSIRRGGREVFFQPKVPIDSTPYKVEQVFYPSKDGTKVSMFVVRHKDLPTDGSAPFMIYGYGGFNISLTPMFSAGQFVWLEQGGGLAIPNLRGGGEYGEDWHKAGMLTKKQNVFDDFIAAAEFLKKKGYTGKRLAIRGGSNGGLLVGAAMTQRPELFRAVACHVPLLDMVRYHLFGSGKTWISEYGSTDDPEQFKAIFAYSPYQNTHFGTAYPALLMLSADSDDRVDPVHARKFVAAIRHATTSKYPVWLRVETNAGHGGGDMIKKKVAATADELAFLFHELGIVVK
ncbi:MAG: prolyl oligopeptidase family serine peptidase [Pseudomonadota bacterium]